MVLSVTLWGVPAYARGIQLSQTRVILQQPQAEGSVRVWNGGGTSVLLQAWIDDGNAAADPAQLSVPVLVTPPMQRIDPQQSQALRLRLVQPQRLPQDRETLYYLNVLSVPQRLDGSGPQLQLAIRSRIKVLQRPVGLAGRADDAPAALRWSLGAGAAGAWSLRVSNTTPWHVNLAALALGGTELDERDGVIAPLSTQEYALPEGVAAGSPQVAFAWMDDAGTQHRAQAALQP